MRSQNPQLEVHKPILQLQRPDEEAFNFYKSVLGGEFTMLQRFKEMPGSGEVAESEKDLILHVTRTKALSIMGSVAPEAHWALETGF